MDQFKNKTKPSVKNTPESNLIRIREFFKMQGMGDIDLVMETSNALSIFRSLGDDLGVSSKVINILEDKDKQDGKDKIQVWNEMKNYLEKAVSENCSCEAIEKVLEERFGNKSIGEETDKIKIIINAKISIEELTIQIFESKQYKKYETALLINNKINYKLIPLVRLENASGIRDPNILDLLKHAVKASEEVLNAAQELAEFIKQPLEKYGFSDIEKKVARYINDPEYLIRTSAEKCMRGFAAIAQLMKELNVLEKMLEDYENFNNGFEKHCGRCQNKHFDSTCSEDNSSSKPNNLN